MAVRANAEYLVDLTGRTVIQAVGSDEPDYEDALVRIAAESLQVDAIISYDKKALWASRVPKLDVDEARKLLEAESQNQ